MYASDKNLATIAILSVRPEATFGGHVNALSDSVNEVPT